MKRPWTRFQAAAAVVVTTGSRGGFRCWTIRQGGDFQRKGKGGDSCRFAARPSSASWFFRLRGGLIGPAQQQPVRITSPDGAVEFAISGPPQGMAENPSPRYRVGFHGKTVIADSGLGLQLEGQPPFPGGWKPAAVKTLQGDETYRVPAGKSNPIRDHYHGLVIDYAEGGGQNRTMSIEARAYDDGVAFRYIVPEQPALHEGITLTRKRTRVPVRRRRNDFSTHPPQLHHLV